MAKDFNIYNGIECRGEWWVFGAADKNVKGVLTCFLDMVDRFLIVFYLKQSYRPMIYRHAIRL